MYIIQEKLRPWEKWEFSLGKFKTLEEAKKIFNNLPEAEKKMSRIAEAYTVTRYRAIKKG